MTFDAVNPPNDMHWRDAFHAFLTAPYEGNATSKLAMDCWFYDNFSLPDANKARLDFVQAYNRKTNAIIDCFRLNGCMMFSHDPAVLTIPYACATDSSSNSADRRDRHVGVWLNDFGDHTALQSMARTAISQLTHNQSCSTIGEICPISGAIHEALNDTIPNATKVLGPSEIRIARNAPFARTFHTDFIHGEEETWSYVVGYGFLNSPTSYKLPNDVIIAPPQFTLYSHVCGTTDYSHLRGVKHAATGHPEGRAVILFPDNSPNRTFYQTTQRRSPWQFAFSI